MFAAPKIDDNAAIPINALPACLLKPFASAGPLYKFFEALTKFRPKLPAILQRFFAVFTVWPAAFSNIFASGFDGLNFTQLFLDIALKKLFQGVCAAKVTPTAAHKYEEILFAVLEREITSLIIGFTSVSEAGKFSPKPFFLAI